MARPSHPPRLDYSNYFMGLNIKAYTVFGLWNSVMRSDGSWATSKAQCGQRVRRVAGSVGWVYSLKQKKTRCKTYTTFLLLFAFLTVLLFLQLLRVLFLISAARTLYNRIRDHWRISSPCNLNPFHYPADMQPATSAMYLDSRNTMKSRDASYFVTQVT
jgi:hypothetical protein